MLFGVQYTPKSSNNVVWVFDTFTILEKDEGYIEWEVNPGGKRLNLLKD